MLLHIALLLPNQDHLWEELQVSLSSQKNIWKHMWMKMTHLFLRDL